MGEVKKKMMVCGHGNVSEYCQTRGMVVTETWDGDISDYSGSCHILVTGQKMPENEYYYLKDKLASRGIELISTRHEDNPAVLAYMAYAAKRRKVNYAGRQPFGYQKRNGEVIKNPAMIAVAQRIIAMKDAGATLRQIREDEGVHHPDGRKISVSTIQQIIKNRNKYEEG